MVPRDRLDPSIGINKVSTAIAHMRNRDLLPDDQCRCQGCAAAGRFLLDGALCFTNCGLHNLLEGLFHRIGFDVEEVGMKLADNMPGNAANGSIACHFTELMSAHAVGNNVKTEG